MLAGGGLAGIAWETGFLLGVQDAQPAAAERLLHADVLLGTSAGSAVAAQISGGVPLAELFARQVAKSTHEIKPGVELTYTSGLRSVASLPLTFPVSTP